MEPTIERWYSMKEICEYLGVSRDTVLAWIEKRNMPAAKIGDVYKRQPVEPVISLKILLLSRSFRV